MANKKINSFFINFWEKSKNFSQISFFEKIIFYILVFFEQLYIFFFKLISCFEKKLRKKRNFSFKVISVGNISVGGTGKSVFVSFLIEKLKSKKTAIVLRGYKSKAERTGKSFLISDGKNIFYDPLFVGDESYMLAKSLNVPVVIGPNRLESCDLLAKEFNDLDFVILDDAYQNFKVEKDLEILLLDAKSPFENNHCLPAGRLREKDFLRADIVVLTHANSVSFDDLQKNISIISKKINRNNIFAGIHKFDDLYFQDEDKVTLDEIKNKDILAFAGIGSFEHFKESIKELNCNNILFKEYPDHYSYDLNDLIEIQNYLKLGLIDLIITTQKDWVKIYPLLQNKKKLPFYILRVDFEFIDNNQDKNLSRIVNLL